MEACKIIASKVQILLLLGCFVILFSCKKNDPDIIVSGLTKIKVINAIQGNQKQDVYIDEDKLIKNLLAFGEMSDYIKISSGSRRLTFTDENNQSTYARLNFIPALTYSTFLISDNKGNREILNYEDNLSTSGSTIAKIRFINLTSSFNTGINISVQTGAPFVNALLFKEASNYFNIEAGTALRYNVVGSGSIKTINGTDLLPGKIYSIWFSGLTAATLEAHLIIDN